MTGVTKGSKGKRRKERKGEEGRRQKEGKSREKEVVPLIFQNVVAALLCCKGTVHF